jgi:hypothetical protein
MFEIEVYKPHVTLLGQGTQKAQYFVARIVGVLVYKGGLFVI